MKSISILSLVFGLMLGACSDTGEQPPPSNSTTSNGGSGQSGSTAIEWLVPVEEVFDGGPGKDGIPSLTEPELVGAGSAVASYLQPGDLVIGFKVDNDVRAYPHKILNWHEIINDQVGSKSVAITYCPLTGTAVGWDRRINGVNTTFGVSGLLYQTNLMPYDRATESTWSQMKFQCVYGGLIGDMAKTYQVFETRWDTWVKMFPETTVVSRNTGFSRTYTIFPYGDYRTNHNSFLFPFSPMDDRLPNKERVLGVLIDGSAKVYPIKEFGDAISVIHDSYQGTELVIVGSAGLNFAMAFRSSLSDGTTLTFEPLQDKGQAVMVDHENNYWNVFGEAVSGPRQGQKLPATESLIGYWFTFGSFYPEPRIFRTLDKG